MKPIEEILKAMSSAQGELRARVNDALAKLGPIEQIESGQPVISALREMDWAKNRLEELGKMLQEKIDGLESIVSEVESSVKAKLIESGDVISAADKETLIANAKKEGADEVQEELTNLRASIETYDERMDEIRKGNGEVVASLMKRDDVVSDDYKDRVKMLAGRLAKAKELNLDSEQTPRAFQQMVGHSLSEEGESAFNSEVERTKELIASTGGKGNARQTQPVSPGGGNQSDGEAKKVTFI